MRILEAENGFSPENIVRIRRGEPAQTDQGPIEQVLDERQLSVLEGVAAGLQHHQIGNLEPLHGRRHINQGTVQRIVGEAFSAINVPKDHKIQVVGFFPIKIYDDILFGKDLTQLTDKQLRFLEALSQGLNFQEITDHGISKAPGALSSRVSKAWPEAKYSQFKILRIANGLRAQRVAKAKTVDSEELLHEDFSLDGLAKS